MIRTYLFLFLLIAAALPSKAAQLIIQLHHVVGGRTLQLDSGKYQNGVGQEFSVSMLKYYLSNIVLEADDGSVVYDSGYYLVDEEDPQSRKIVLSGLPTRTYTGLRFTIGVDSLHNCSGAQNGALDPVHGMFWSWNSGYIFFKLEGHSPRSSAPGGVFEYHIGGYKPPAVCMRKVYLPLPAPVKLSQDFPATLTLRADVLRMLDKPLSVDFHALPSVTDYHHAEDIANGYARMFSVEQ